MVISFGDYDHKISHSFSNIIINLRKRSRCRSPCNLNDGLVEFVKFNINHFIKCMDIIDAVTCVSFMVFDLFHSLISAYFKLLKVWYKTWGCIKYQLKKNKICMSVPFWMLGGMNSERRESECESERIPRSLLLFVSQKSRNKFFLVPYAPSYNFHNDGFWIMKSRRER